MGRDRIEHLERTLQQVRRDGDRRRHRGMRRRTRRRGDLRARLPRRVRDRRPLRLGGGHVPRVPRRCRADACSRTTASTVSWPTSTRCARASNASVSSTIRCGSSRAASTTRCPTRRSNGWRCCGIGGGVGDAAGAALEHLYDRLAIGGFVIVEDDADPAVHDAVEKFRARRGIAEPVEHVGPTGVAWRKAAEAAAPTRRRRRTRRRSRARAARATHDDRHDRPLRRRRLLQHAPGGRPHAAIADPRATSRASTISATR